MKRIEACFDKSDQRWSGGQPPQIVSALLDVLPQMLGLDFAHCDFVSLARQQACDLSPRCSDGILERLFRGIGKKSGVSSAGS